MFSNDPATAARYDRAILAAAKEAPTLPLAWRLLFNDGDSESRLWQGRRFMGAYRSTDRASAGVAA